MTDRIEDYFFATDENVEFGKGGDLPHRHQNEKIQYVTFRLADSLPISKRTELNEGIARFKELHPEPWDEKVLREYQRRFSPAVERMLHNGYGDCALRIPAARRLLEDSIRHNEGREYEVIAYVIMPNHVHMLIRPFESTKIKGILQAIKSSSAHNINKLLNRKGKLWLRESFDRIVRTRDHFKKYYNYIRNNPRNLPPEDYTLYLNNRYGL